MVNALGIRHGSGGYTLIRLQLEALAQVAPEVELCTLVSRGGDVRDLPGQTVEVDTRSVAQRFAWEQAVLPRKRADVLYNVGNFAPLWSRTPSVLLLQNALYYGDRSHLSDEPLRRLKIVVNHASIRRAAAVVAVSESLASDAVRAVPSAARKVYAIPSASPPWPDAAHSSSHVRPPYLLTVSSGAAHKCLANTIRGWAMAKARVEVPRLVVVGAVPEESKARYRAIAGQSADRIAFLGVVGDRAQLKWLYENAELNLQMSAVESFSFTVLEAESLGCPNIVSDIPAHREVAGPSTTFVPVGDSAALAEALTTTLAGPRQRTGHVVSAQWSWHDNARRLLGVFKDVGNA